MRLIVLAGAAAALLAPGVASAIDTKLVCDGVGTRPESASTSGTFSLGGESGSGSATTVMSGQVRERLRFEFSDTAGRIRMPKSLVPPVNMGGTEGWWPLYDVSITDEQIKGRFRLNPLNKPLVTIDRISGDVEMVGKFLLSFRGTCQVEERSVEARKF